jgi:hypothetical protein
MKVGKPPVVMPLRRCSVVVGASATKRNRRACEGCVASNLNHARSVYPRAAREPRLPNERPTVARGEAGWPTPGGPRRHAQLQNHSAVRPQEAGPHGRGASCRGARGLREGQNLGATQPGGMRTRCSQTSRIGAETQPCAAQSGGIPTHARGRIGGGRSRSGTRPSPAGRARPQPLASPLQPQQTTLPVSASAADLPTALRR